MASLNNVPRQASTIAPTPPHLICQLRYQLVCKLHVGKTVERENIKIILFLLSLHWNVLEFWFATNQQKNKIKLAVSPLPRLMNGNSLCLTTHQFGNGYRTWLNWGKFRPWLWGWCCGWKPKTSVIFLAIDNTVIFFMLTFPFSKSEHKHFL